VLTVPYPAHEITSHYGPMTFTTYNAPISEGMAIIGAYFVATAILGLAIFERKEFN